MSPERVGESYVAAGLIVLPVIVRCLTLLDPLGVPIDRHPGMAVGIEFVVLEISFSSGYPARIRVYNESLHGSGDLPGLWHAGMFEVLDPRLPPNWEAHITGPPEGGRIKLAPASWQAPNFWVDVDEWSEFTKGALEDYQRELAIILDHAKVPPERDGSTP